MNPAFREPGSVEINQVQIRPSPLRFGVSPYEFVQTFEMFLVLQQEILIPADQSCLTGKKKSDNHSRNTTECANESSRSSMCVLFHIRSRSRFALFA